MSRRATPNTTPFIPPLPVPLPGGSPQPPVIPSPSGGESLRPAWANTPQVNAGYPMYPNTPYTNPPFIPSGGYTPATTPGAMPGGYIPPPAPGPHYPQAPPPGVSLDYTGYPQFANATPWPVQPPTLHPSTPWGGPTSAPLPGQGPAWHAPRNPYPPHPPPPQQQAYPSFPQPPQTAGPYSGAFPGAGPPGWGGGGGGYTPGQQNPLDPWGLHGGMHHTPGPGWGTHQPGPPPQLPPHFQTQAQLGRASAQEGDRVGHFMAGKNYGPVLEPFLVRVVKARLQLNPLIQPLPDDGSDRPHLKWNMTFPSNDCYLSTDPPQKSWVDGRHEPLTWPRVASVQIISETLPWMLIVKASSRHVGVTCGDLIDQLSHDFSLFTNQDLFNLLSTQMKGIVGDAYRLNRSRAHGVPGGTLGDGLRRLDFLGKDTIFGGIVSDDRAVKRICGDNLPCTFVLKTLRRYAMTASEIREHEARQRAAAAVDADARRSSTVTTDDGDDDE